MALKDTLYVIAGSHPSSEELFQKIKSLPGSWLFVNNEKDLKTCSMWKPRYIFFLEWQHVIPQEIFNSIECVYFHPSQLPEGRGNNPIQNLILLGHEYTYLTAFKVTDEPFAGPIYTVAFLTLNGSLKEIINREMELAFNCIKEIIYYHINPSPQDGIITTFENTFPNKNEISNVISIRQLYDFIRMFDDDNCQRACIKVGNKYLEFTNARLADCLTVDIIVK